MNIPSALLKRRLLKGLGLLLVLPYFRESLAQADDPAYSQENLMRLQLKKQGVQIEMEPLADTGNSIPMGIAIQAPGQLKIQSFEVIAPDNPSPIVLRINLPQAQNSYRMGARIRLARSQDVWVIATLNDGSKIADAKHCVVTLNACFDAT